MLISISAALKYFQTVIYGTCIVAFIIHQFYKHVQRMYINVQLSSFIFF